MSKQIRFYKPPKTQALYVGACEKIICKALKRFKDIKEPNSFGNPKILVFCRQEAKKLGIPIKLLDWVYYNGLENRYFRLI